MPKTPCKGVKNDGSPCQGQGLKQFDGYCIAHAPREKTRAWRSRGGKNASNAARADKRIPKRHQGVLDALEQGLFQLWEGKLDPAVYNAMCNGARVMAQIYRLADLEMELIRKEEFETAAMEVAGVHGDLAILKAAAEFKDQENQFRFQSFIEQGLVAPHTDIPEGFYAPKGLVLTDAGRRRFGLQQGAGYTQDDIDRIRALAEKPLLFPDQCVTALKTLSRMRADIENAIADLSHDPGPVRDPITGQSLSQPPAGIDSASLYPQDPADFADPESEIATLKEQRREILTLARILEFRFKAQLGPPKFDRNSDNWKAEETAEESEMQSEESG